MSSEIDVKGGKLTQPSESQTDFGTDEGSDGMLFVNPSAYLIRRCKTSSCMKFRDRIDDFIISDDSSEGLWCSTCHNRYQLVLKTKHIRYLIHVRTSSNNVYEITTNGESDDFIEQFPEDWADFFIQKVA